MRTVRRTVAQALVRFLANQYSERDGVQRRLVPGCWGIFGHGNVAGVAQALLEARVEGWVDLPYYLARIEQAMVHASAGFAKTLNRLQAFACTASIGPGSTNMLTGAALATVNRLPVLLLPSDVFATRAAGPVLQELEDPGGYDVSVNDAFRPLSEELFAPRVWHVPLPEPAALTRAVSVLRSARRPLIVAGGGVIYAEATQALRRFAESTGIPACDTQAGKGALGWDHPLAVGGVGSTGSQAANAPAREPDVVLGVGTRYSDFTTASRTAFQDPDVRFGLDALTGALAGFAVDGAYTQRHRRLTEDWNRVVDRAYHLGHQPLPAQSEVIGTLNEVLGPATSWSRRPEACPATCRCSGGRGTRSPASLGARVIRVQTIDEFRDALKQAKASGRTTGGPHRHRPAPRTKRTRRSNGPTRKERE